MRAPQFGGGRGKGGAGWVSGLLGLRSWFGFFRYRASAAYGDASFKAGVDFTRLYWFQFTAQPQASDFLSGVMSRVRILFT